MRPLLICSLCTLALAGCLGAPAAKEASVSCAGYTYDPEGPSLPQGFAPCRVFKGRLRLPQQKQLILPDRPLQVVGLVFEPEGGASTDGAVSKPDAGVSEAGSSSTPTPPAQPTDKVTPRFFYGPQFHALEGAGYRPQIPFSVSVPCGKSVNLALQVPRTSGDAEPGMWVAQMAFAKASGSGTTTLIPRQAEDSCAGSAGQYDLGLVDLELAKRGELSSGVITLGKGNSASPLSLVPAPEGNLSDQDTDGDGIIDSAQTFGSLPDVQTPGKVAEEGKTAPDGIPDLFE